jgi:hypothetical protein
MQGATIICLKSLFSGVNDTGEKFIAGVVDISLPTPKNEK